MKARTITLPGSVIAAAIVVVGLATPAAAHEAASLAHRIDGSSIKPHSIPGNRLKSNTVTGKQINESTLGVVPKASRASSLPPLVWHNITSFTNGWKAVTAAQNALPVAYAIDAEGQVHLRGALTGGTVDEAAFTLPSSVVSSTLNLYFPVVADGGTLGLLTVGHGGEVIPTGGGTAEDIEVSSFTGLDGIAFDGH